MCSELASRHMVALEKPSVTCSYPFCKFQHFLVMGIDKYDTCVSSVMCKGTMQTGGLGFVFIIFLHVCQKGLLIKRSTVSLCVQGYCRSLCYK